MTIEIIEADEEHLGALAQLHRQLFVPPWDEASFGALMEQSGTLAILASAEAHAPIGFILARIVADEAEILTLGVLPRYQRHGIAARLVTAVSQRSTERGAGRIYLEVASDNAAARQLYLSQGFEEVGRRPGYYERPPGPPVDALIMAKTLAAVPQVDGPHKAQLYRV